MPYNSIILSNDTQISIVIDLSCILKWNSRDWRQSPSPQTEASVDARALHLCLPSRGLLPSLVQVCAPSMDYGSLSSTDLEKSSSNSSYSFKKYYFQTRQNTLYCFLYHRGMWMVEECINSLLNSFGQERSPQVIYEEQIHCSVRGHGAIWPEGGRSIQIVNLRWKGGIDNVCANILLMCKHTEAHVLWLLILRAL